MAIPNDDGLCCKICDRFKLEWGNFIGDDGDIYCEDCIVSGKAEIPKWIISVIQRKSEGGKE